MPIYTVTCRDRPGGAAERLFVEALSAGQAVGYATAHGKYVDNVAITPRDQITGDAVLLAEDPEPPEAPQCAACGYSLEGLPVRGRSIRCPECGHDNLIILLGRKAAVIRSTEVDVSRFDRTSPKKPPGSAASVWAVVMGMVGFLHIGPALLAVALGVYALERSNRSCGLAGVAIGALAVLTRIALGVI